MNDEPLVTVVMPYLRAEKTIARAIDSVRAQTLRRIEVVTVADGSNDGSRAIVEAIAQRDPRIRSLAYATNGGPSFARNRAVEASRARWVAVLDADDAFDPTRLERLIDEAGDASIVVDNLLAIDPDDGEECGPLFRALPSSLTVALIASQRVAGSTYDYGYLKPMVRRDFLARGAIAYDERLRTAEDLLLLLECAIVGGAVRTVDAPLYHYNLPMSPKRRKLSSTTHSVPRDRDVAVALESLLERRADLLDPQGRAAIEARIEGLENGADVSRFRYCVHRGEFGHALRLVLGSARVRAYVARTVLGRTRVLRDAS